MLDPAKREVHNKKSKAYMQGVRATEEGNAKLNASNAKTMRLWRVKNPGKNVANTRAYALEKDKRIPLWANLTEIKLFYEAKPAGCVVDHIIPLRGKLVSGLHCSTNLQYLTATENSSKGNSFNPETFVGP